MTAAVTAIGAQALVPGVLLPDIAEGVGLSAVTAGGIFGIYGLALAASSFAAGVCLRRLAGRARVVGGLAGLAAGLVVVASASDGLGLLTGVVVAGAAAGIALPAVYGLVAVMVDGELASRATSRVLLGWALSLVVGIPVAGLIAQLFSWRSAFVVLAALALVAAVFGLGLPSADPPEERRPQFREVLSDRAVLPLLGAVAAFMATFYGVFAFVGSDARAHLGHGPGLSSAVALAYGCGFASAGLLHRWTNRLERILLPLTFAALIAVYALLPLADRTLPTVLLAAAVWGMVNETALTMLVVRISRASAASEALALYNSITYISAAVGTACAGAIVSSVGFARLGLAAAVVCAAGLLMVAASPQQSQLA
ncbi:MFS transporter [Streptomyces sp. NPDC059224]|uniref:MFS transporter n=1 Tax=Streptomyces sp. NPDC059224 TaxID=3346775 RepID=UPI0036934875